MIIYCGHYKEESMAKILCLLYDDPVDGSSKSFTRVPTLERYAAGQRFPKPRAIAFKAGQL